MQSVMQQLNHLFFYVFCYQVLQKQNPAAGAVRTPHPQHMGCSMLALCQSSKPGWVTA
jgi:hypothetical protein